MRLIDADSIKWESVEEEYGARTPAVVACQSLIQNEPTIDPVRRGKWVVKWWDDDGDARDWACSVCGFSHVYFDDMPTNYCPNCGALMQGGKDENSKNSTR